MGWTTPKTWATNEVVTAANMNTHLRDNVAFLGSPPACSVYHSAAVSVPDSTQTILSANSENFDTDSMHSTVSNTSRITINTAGRYSLSVTINSAPSLTANTARVVWFLVNGTTAYQLVAIPGVNSATIGTDISASRTLVLAATDYVEVRVLQNTTAANLITLAEFSAFLITVP